MSSLTSELFSLLLLQDPSVSFMLRSRKEKSEILEGNQSACLQVHHQHLEEV
ncbi:hypothetical protein HanRHA438_Chr15g0701951 [Helianthus annuus]|nr:hypothetical protein HanRHA438_Chr15g0701951 [Helianthus annuus]